MCDGKRYQKQHLTQESGQTEAGSRTESASDSGERIPAQSPIENRRSILRNVVSLSSVGLLGTGSLSGNVVGQTDAPDVDLLKGAEKQRAIARARRSEEFSALKQRLRGEYDLRVPADEATVIDVGGDDSDELVVSFFPREPGQTEPKPDTYNLVVELRDGAVGESGAMVASFANGHPEAVTVLVRTSTGIEEQRIQLESETIEENLETLDPEVASDPIEEAPTGDVRSQFLPSRCSICRDFYVYSCRIGTGLGVLAVCIAVGATTLGVGGAICVAVGLVIDDFVTERGCQPNARLECQLMGFC